MKRHDTEKSDAAKSQKDFDPIHNLISFTGKVALGMNFLNDPPHSPKRHMISPILGGGDMQRLLGDPSAIFCFVLFFGDGE